MNCCLIIFRTELNAWCEWTWHSIWESTMMPSRTHFVLCFIAWDSQCRMDIVAMVNSICACWDGLLYVNQIRNIIKLPVISDGIWDVAKGWNKGRGGGWSVYENWNGIIGCGVDWLLRKIQLNWAAFMAKLNRVHSMAVKLVWFHTTLRWLNARRFFMENHVNWREYRFMKPNRVGTLFELDTTSEHIRQSQNHTQNHLQLGVKSSQVKNPWHCVMKQYGWHFHEIMLNDFLEHC